ncbi:MAG: type IV pilus secretin PilQ, partial [Endozoicomonadaceae bacterium]|nr:type IV pilus secretin PilQ [Endozoicomonadaceae bacterium]
MDRASPKVNTQIILKNRWPIPITGKEMEQKAMDLVTTKPVKHFIKSVFIPVSLLILFLTAIPAYSVVLKHMEASSVENDRFMLKLKFSGTPPEMQSYALQDPTRIIIDLPDTSNETGQDHEINKGGLEKVTAIEVSGRTRLIATLNEPVSLKSTIQDNTLLLTMTPYSVNTTLQDAGLQPLLQAVDFKRSKDGAGNIIFLISEQNTLVTIDNSNKKLVLNFPGLRLPDFLNQRRFDMTEFATPVQFVNLIQQKDKVQAFIELTGRYEHISWQSGKKFILSARKIDSGQSAGSANMTHKGERLSLNFQNIEIRAVLQLLADEQNFNLVASDAVKGNITLRLADVPWDQALDIILRSKGLDKRLDGNVMIVAPAQELAIRERESLESKQQIEELSPLRTELIQINYAKASDMDAVLKGSNKNRILSERGSVQVVERVNSLLVNETQEKLDEIKKLIKKVDVPIKQVMIEARIVEARTNIRDELGVEWGTNKEVKRVTRSNNFIEGGEVKETGTKLPQSIKSTRNLKNIAANLGGSKAVDDIFVNLPIADPAAKFALGYITNSVDLFLALTAMELDKKVKIISQPQVITANKKKATIKKGEERAFETTSDNNGTNTVFKDVV